jgi:hypothetical protein
MKRRRGPHRGAGIAPPAAPPAPRESDDPGAVAARARLDALLDRLTRVGLQVIVVAPPDAERMAARDHARDAAIAAGRGPLLDEATAAARGVAMRAFAQAGFSGTWAATDWSVSVVSARDRVSAAAAFEEAAMAAIVEDLLDDGTLDLLRSTSNELAGMNGVPSPGSLSTIAAPAGAGIRGPLQVAIIGAFAVFLLLTGFVALSPVAIVLGFAIITGMARRRSQPDP